VGAGACQGVCGGRRMIGLASDTRRWSNFWSDLAAVVGPGDDGADEDGADDRQTAVGWSAREHCRRVPGSLSSIRRWVVSRYFLSRCRRWR
jgi:hypothetical protein